MAEQNKSPRAIQEEATLAFWNENKIFEKTVDKDGPEYVFYDGPPFATGLPHYGHIVASVIKDVIPRYYTMKGYKVPRVWGWDCHGLPIENIVEKELGFKHKKDIIEFGIEKFNQKCRDAVMTYAAEWEKFIPRIGRWVNMKNGYRTMDKPFMESVWWVFKQLYEKKLVYEDYRSMHICPRCETTLSQQEVSEGYKDIKDLSVTAKFKVRNSQKSRISLSPSEKDSSPYAQYGSESFSSSPRTASISESSTSHSIELPENTFILAWTTTPWTLPGNVALAVGKDITYVLAEKEGVSVILAKDLQEKVAANWSVKKEMSGSELVGMEYEPLFSYYSENPTTKNRENGWKVYAGDFVTTDSGTGIVHIAPAFGEDDMQLGKANNLPFVQHLGMDGIFKPEVSDFAGVSVKPIEDHTATDVLIIKYLAAHGTLFSKEKYEHSYPHCWRCDTPLLNYATSSWFVSVTKLKETLLGTAKNVSWSPEHIKEGRFGKWLEGARDWSISRQRFWASVIPLWRCNGAGDRGQVIGGRGCGEEIVFGAVSDLEKKCGRKIEDLHKDIVDEITFPCDKCGGTMKRIPDVLDTWFDSGSMPYGEKNYPFSNKERFEKTFPAQFIAEGLDQTRAWFYYLHVLSGALFEKNAFQNVIVNGIVLAEDGKKMSKKLKNYPDPMEIVHKYGADALRLYLMSSPVVAAENLAFSEKGVDEWAKKVLMRLENVHAFYALYENDMAHEAVAHTENVLDAWIVARLHETHAAMSGGFQKYQLDVATRPLSQFVDDLSTWYVRRSRDRLKNDGEDKKAALETMRYLLRETAIMMAPVAPFTAEQIWQKLKRAGDFESVHLAAWSEVKTWDAVLLEKMQVTRDTVTLALEARVKAGMSVRQPLASLSIEADLAPEYAALIIDEVNVKEIKKGTFALDTTLTPQLKEEGLVRELVRAIQDARKKAGKKPGDKVFVTVGAPQELLTIIQKYSKELSAAVNAVAIDTAAGTGDTEIGDFGVSVIIA